MTIIQLLVLDVDGTLTDGSIFYGERIEIKAFNAKDGLILKLFPALGIETVFLTGRSSEAVAHRAADLGAQVLQGVAKKEPVLRKLLLERKFTAEQCAYIGDDLNDYAAMKLCGFRACPADASTEIRRICNYVSQYPGGHGAVRNICEHLLKQEMKYDLFLSHWGVL